MTTLLGRTPYSPRTIPASNPASQNVYDVIAVPSDPFFFVSDAPHELSKRKLEVSGSKDDLLWRLFEALEAEIAEGWTLGYLLSTKPRPFNGKGRDSRSLIGHHLEGCNSPRDGTMILELSAGETVTLPSNKPTDHRATIKMDHDLFCARHTLDGTNAAPRNPVKKPLPTTEIVAGARKHRREKDAGTACSLKREGMRAASFLSPARVLAGEASVREDRMCGHVWRAEKGRPARGCRDAARGTVAMRWGMERWRRERWWGTRLRGGKEMWGVCVEVGMMLGIDWNCSLAGMYSQNGIHDQLKLWLCPQDSAPAGRLHCVALRCVAFQMTVKTANGMTIASRNRNNVQVTIPSRVQRRTRLPNASLCSHQP